MVVGLAALFIDHKTHKWGKRLAIGGLVVTALATMVLNLQEDRTKDEALSASIAREDETRAILLNLTEQTKPIPDLVAMLRDFGFSSEGAKAANTLAVARSIDANRAYQTLLKSRTGAKSETHVEYFPKDVDGDRVIAAIQEARLDVLQKRPVRQEATNAIWVGDDVPIDDAKLVSLALLRAGVDVVAVRRFRDGTGQKSGLIQVGADAALRGRIPLSVAEVMTMTLPARDPATQ